MRNIKFRAWDKEKSTWYEPIHEAYKGNLFELLVSFKGDLVTSTISGLQHDSMFPNRFELMQYTGLKDKNGVEIYEGDIVKCTQRGESKNGVVNFKKGMFNWEYDVGAISWLHKANKDWNGEVIGNIYENPDLLKGDNK